MDVEQESKYEIVDGELVNRATGGVIPADEPVFIFRAQDIWAVPALKHYHNQVSSPAHAAVVASRIHDFEDFARDNPDRMKEPDSLAAAPDPTPLPDEPTPARVVGTIAAQHGHDDTPPTPAPTPEPEPVDPSGGADSPSPHPVEAGVNDQDKPAPKVSDVTSASKGKPKTK